MIIEYKLCPVLWKSTSISLSSTLKTKALTPTVAIVAAALMQYISEQEAAAKATTVPEVGESLWKHYGKMQKIANRF